MQKLRNYLAYILAAFVIFIAILIILVIWEVPINIDWDMIRDIIGDGMLTVLTVLTAGAIVFLIFRMFYKQEIKPPKPPSSGGYDASKNE